MPLVEIEIWIQGRDEKQDLEKQGKLELCKSKCIL